MNNRQSNQKSQTKRIYFVLSVLLLALIFVANANKTYAQTGIMVGSDQLILNNADNLYYGVMGESSNAGASALLLQRPAGSNIFRVDPYGNVISAGNVGGAGLCMGSDCRTSWADVVSDSSFWQLSGTNLFASSTAWNVGIGKTNPNYKLDVNGGINAAYGSSGGYYINTNQIIMQNSQTMNFGWVSSNRSYFQAAYLGPGNTEASIITNGYKRLTVNSAGNVGIGITNPSAMLTVNGNTLLGGATQISPLGGAGQVLVMADNTGTLYATSSAALLPPGSVSLPSGTSGQTLRHDGTVWTADSNLFNNGTRIGIGTTNPGSGIPYDTKLHIRGSGTSTSGRTAFVVENTSANSAAIFQLRNSSGNTLSVQLSGPSYTIGERANFGASADIWFSTDGDMSSGGTHTVNFSAGGYNNGATMTITPGNPGNVGIGTTSPNVKLNVVDGTPAGTYTGLYTGMVFDGSNVGEYLHIKTTDGGSLSSGIILGSGNKNWYINAKGPTSNNNFDLGYRAETADGFTPGGSTLFSLTTSGNVGIGITNPSARLTVNGNTLLGGATQISPLGGAGQVLVMADNTGTLYATSSSALLPPGSVSLPSGTSGQTLRHNGSVWTAASNLYNNGTNVGIGTTNPLASLHIDGGYLIASGGIRVRNYTQIMELPNSSSDNTWYYLGRISNNDGGFRLLAVAEGVRRGANSGGNGVLTLFASQYNGVNTIQHSYSGAVRDNFTGYFAIYTDGTHYYLYYLAKRYTAPTLRFNSTYYLLSTPVAQEPTGDLVYTTQADSTAYLQGNLLGKHIAYTNNDSASTPAYTWIGDEDLGIFRPAADNLAIATQGIERFRINASGRVIINDVLDIANSASATSTGQEVLILRTATNSTIPGSGAILNFGHTNNNATLGQIRSFTETSNRVALAFSTYNTGLSEKMRITAVGNVGIGITNPSALLTVNGSTILGGATQITPLGGAGNVLVMADNTGILYSTSTAAIVSPIVSSASGWTASGTTVYKTDNNGNVGIGNTNPNYKLIVSESNSSRNTLRDVLALESTVSGPYINFGQGLVFRSRTYSNNEIHDKARIRTLASDHSTATTGISLIFEVATSSNSTVTSEVMRITHNGDVGIGTTVPNYKLEIVGTDKNLLTIRNANNAADTEATLGFKMTTYTGETNYAEIGAIRGNWSDVSHIVFRTRHSSALAERIRINSAGNLGIGVSNPSARLTVNGNTVLGGATQISALGGGGNLLVMTDDAGNLYSTSTSAVIPEAMPIGTSGQTIRHNGSAWVANGNLFNNGTNVGIGTTAPSARLDVAGTLAIKSEGQLPDRITGGSGMILSGYNPTGSVIGRIFIGDGSGYTFNFATRNNGVTSDKVSIQSLGNVGIGITNPSARLTVNGNTILGGATQITPLGGAGNVMVMADNTGTLYATTTAILAGDYLSLSGGTMAGDINLGGNDISNINKLTVNTIDPLYRIKGVNYSSFAAAIVGGVKEEYVGKAQINKLNFKGEYEFILDFAKQKEGSDLWVWYKTVDFSAENVDALVTNYGNFAQVYYLIEGEKLIFRASEPTTISYRLIGRRHDWRNWPTRAIDQNQTAGFVID